MAKTLTIADLFCGAGGTSTGAIQAAERFGYKVELTAINHWNIAVATHTLNHPKARHLCTQIDDVNPRQLYAPGKLDMLWASPECTHHSRARGGKPMHDQSRATAWCVTRWAEALMPGIIFVENVQEFLDWGPLGTNGRPLASKKGAHHSLVQPFIVPIDHTGNGRIAVNDIDQPLSTVCTENRHALVNPFLVPVAHGGGEERAQSIDVPMPTICGNRGDMAVIEPHLLPQHSCGLLRPVSDPAPTVACDGAIALVEPFLTKYYGTAEAADINEPLGTVTTKDRFALVTPIVQIDDQQYMIRLRWRMLQPHELAAGQSFPKAYQFAGNKTETVKQIGNAVPPELAAALVSCHL
jgi:site-specific DNA-cytosine methylase